MDAVLRIELQVRPVAPFLDMVGDAFAG